MFDEETRVRVQAALQHDARIQPSAISVSVERGIATLLGQVDSYYKKWTAESVTCGIAGVREVANDLVVVLTRA